MAAVRVVNEIVTGSGSTLALDAAGGSGGTGFKIQRAWKIVYYHPNDKETIPLSQITGVNIGDAHPTLLTCVCDSIDFKPDGDSRLAFIVTANYTSQALSLTVGGYDLEELDPRTEKPSTRKANWSTEASTIEAPSWHWKPFGVDKWVPAVNPVGDLYDGVMTMQPIVIIRVEQLQIRDPNEWAKNIGYINSNQFSIGALDCFPHSVMLRAISATPHLEQAGDQTFRGWKANFEFAYKPGYNSYLAATGAPGGAYLGWDVAIPVSGFNVMNAAGATGRADVEKGALALKLADDGIGTIVGWPNPTIEPTLVGKKTRANVLVAAPNSKATQRPSAQPVSLNLDGTPRNTSLDPLIKRYQVYMDFNMSLMRLRLD